jgi:hypothetical protein
MVPAHVVAVPASPLTANGKIDPAAAEARARHHAGRRCAAPDGGGGGARRRLRRADGPRPRRGGRQLLRPRGQLAAGHAARGPGARRSRRRHRRHRDLPGPHPRPAHGAAARPARPQRPPAGRSTGGRTGGGTGTRTGGRTGGGTGTRTGGRTGGGTGTRTGGRTAPEPPPRAAEPLAVPAPAAADRLVRFTAPAGRPPLFLVHAVGGSAFRYGHLATELAGDSAGAGIADALALRARDLDGPRVCFQYLDIPQLDDRMDSPSMRGYDDTPWLNRSEVALSWGTTSGAPARRRRTTPCSTPSPRGPRTWPDCLPRASSPRHSTPCATRA